MDNLKQAKVISDRLSNGENVSEKEMSKIIDDLNEKELLELLNYAINKEV